MLMDAWSRWFMTTVDRGRWRWFDTLLLLGLVLIAIVTVLAEDAEAASARKYMVLYEGTRGLNFWCLDELPYSIERAMIWDDAAGPVELSEQGFLFARVVETDHCNVDNVYQVRDGAQYAWLFTERVTDGHEDHRHITRGAWWVEWHAE